MFGEHGVGELGALGSGAETNSILTVTSPRRHTNNLLIKIGQDVGLWVNRLCA